MAGRYRLVEPIGGHGASAVYRATDALHAEAVAVKLLPASTGRAQLQAEVSALRLLDLPGVARLLDEGVHDGRPFLAIELVEGAPFPGPPVGDGPRSWEALRGTVVALVEILARVHARGVVHRDLKPDNVLVDASGRPTVLDFGLSAGVVIGSGLDPDRCAVGTPAYAAPEQILGETVDARADLYSLGVMLYEVLAGRLPQEGRVADEFLQARLHGDPDPLARHAPEAPPHVCALVDRLLARDPEARPRSAVDVWRMMRGSVPTESEPPLPWLGGNVELQNAANAVTAGRSVDVVGPCRSGKSRFLDELERKCAEACDEWIRVPPGTGPLESLAPLLGDAAGAPFASLDEALRAVGSRVGEALDRGAVLAVDDWEGVDRLSGGVLEEVLRDRGPDARRVVRCRRGANGSQEAAVEVRLGRFRECDLRPLFAGPDRLFHLREDGARELWRRTEGWPGRIADEVAAWVRAGLARWSGTALVVDRHALARLRAGLVVLPRNAPGDERAVPLRADLAEQLAWFALAGPQASAALVAEARRMPLWICEAAERELVALGALRRLTRDRVETSVHADALDGWTPARRREAHTRIASALTPGSEGRLLHLLQSARLVDVPAESCAVARRLVAIGKLGEAEAALTEGLHALRVHGARDAELPIFREWIAVALAEFTPQAVDRVLYELSRELADPAERSAETRAGLRHLDRFARAALATLDGVGERALEAVESIEPFEDLELERWRLALRVQAARGASPEREQAVLDEIALWAEGRPEPEIQASLSEWLGRLRYRQDRALEAAAHCERAARLGTRVHARLSAMLNGASALMEAHDLAAAAKVAARARDVAAGARHTLFEVRAEWILRAVAYRDGSAGAPDLELVGAASRVGVHDQEALISLTEAAVAWRVGESVAAELADRAAARWSTQGKLWGASLARSLALAASGAPTSEADELAAHVADPGEPLLAGQCLALLVAAGAKRPGATDAVLGALRELVPAEELDQRREVLSAREVLEALSPGGSTLR